MFLQGWDSLDAALPYILGLRNQRSASTSVPTIYSQSLGISIIRFGQEADGYLLPKPGRFP